MDAKKKMIIAKGNPVSSDVISYSFNDTSGKYEITFKNGKIFYYNKNNIIVLENPKKLNPKNYQIFHKGQLLENISEIFVFKDKGSKEYWHICFSNRYEHDYRYDELKINKSVLESSGAKEIFEYLREVVGYISVRTDDNIPILLKQYDNIDFLSDDTAAAVYLNPEKYDAENNDGAFAPIFPFGCNESQYRAVLNALTNQISVIEGPPGTGKTQTILNIIANLVLQGKSVQVVSNNNSAIDNIIEKLASPEYKADFIVARLGRNQRKAAFIEAQTGSYPDFSDWKSDEYESPEFFAFVGEESLRLQEIFRDKNRLAELYQEQYNVKLEYEHLRTIINDNSLQISNKKLSSARLMEFWQEYQDIQDGKRKAGILYRVIRRISLGINVGKIMKEDVATVIRRLQYVFYDIRQSEIENEISSITEKLDNVDAEALMAEFTALSLHCFCAALAKRYGGTQCRPVFTKDHLWQKPDEFLQEYPVVLSTTYTARSSLGKNAKFDYVIMDEASQVDVATGMLSLSCAANAVIVGDTKQLPNVVSSQQKKQLETIFHNHKIAHEYNYTKHSFYLPYVPLWGKKFLR